MKIDIQAYYDKYHQSQKFFDNWQGGIKVLPFNTNASSSAVDKRCGLHGVTGEFFRLWNRDGSVAIEDFEESAIKPVRAYLQDQKQMPADQISEFIRMLKDIMYVNGNLNITDSSFFKFLPLIPNDESLSQKDKSKYKDGQKKLAIYLYSMLPENAPNISAHSSTNLFTKILQESLINSFSTADSIKEREYSVLPNIKKSFFEDFQWMIEQEEAVKTKYIHLFFHFYACYSITQTIANLRAKGYKDNEPYPFYFILNSEKASENHDAVINGWSRYISKSHLDKLFGRSQALDILNSVLGGNVGYYPGILAKLYATPFEENKALCNELLRQYQSEKRSLLDARETDRHVLSSFGDELEIDVNSYEEFIETLERLCVGLQSSSWNARMRKKVIDILRVRFLQSRRGNFVLVLDNEMLTFLIALFTRGKKTRLENVYKVFNKYGIFFNRDTRMAIEDYLLKLNLLDRKSDSGEAQYVTVIL